MNTLFNLGYAAVILLLAFGLWRLCRTTTREETARQALLEETNLGFAPHPADPWQGSNPVTCDELERLWLLPELQPGIDRLLEDVRDEQQKGDRA